MLTNKVQAQALSLPKTISGDPKKKSSQYQQVPAHPPLCLSQSRAHSRPSVCMWSWVGTPEKHKRASSHTTNFGSVSQ